MGTEVQVKQSTSLQLSDGVKEVAKKVDAIIMEVMNLPPEQNGFEMAYVHANAITQITELLTPEYMAPIMKLQNSKMGFLTDVKDGGYKEETVKACLVEALLNGLQVTGNQWNILVGKFYITREGFSALLRKIPELVYDLTQYPPQASPDGTIVRTVIEWTYRNQPKKSKEVKFVVKVNSGMGTDAILGKAERKAKRWLFNEITGKQVADGDAFDSEFDDNSKKSKANQKPVEVKETTQEQQPKAEAQNQGGNEASSSSNEAEVLEAIELANEAQQTRFDKFLKSATSQADVKAKAEQVYNHFKLKLESFNLTVYNQMLASFPA